MFDWLKEKKSPEPRKGMPSPRLSEVGFKKRFQSHFQDNSFAGLQAELDKITHAAWDAYAHSRRVREPAKPGSNSQIRTTSWRRIGLPLMKRSRLRSADTKTRTFRPVSF